MKKTRSRKSRDTVPLSNFASTRYLFKASHNGNQSPPFYFLLKNLEFFSADLNNSIDQSLDSRFFIFFTIKSSGRGFSGPAWQDCSAVWAGQPAQAQVQLPQPEWQTLYRIVLTCNQGWQHKKHKKHLKTTSYCFFLVRIFLKNINIVTTNSENLFLKVNVERASANVVMNDCMNLCIIKEN
jgi:hypothetical protein